MNKKLVGGSLGTRLIALTLAALASGLVATGCATYTDVDEMPVSQPLAPMQEPSWEVGTTWHFLLKWKLLDSGSPVWWRVTEQDASTFTTVDNRGCTLTGVDLFSPYVLVRDCLPSRRGRNQEVTRLGEPWPLEVGRSWRYTASGNYVGERSGKAVENRYAGKPVGWSWESLVTECRVESQVRVKISAGAFDTYKVVCNHPRWRKTWYIAPSLEGIVMHIIDPESAKIRRYERLEIDPAD